MNDQPSKTLTQHDDDQCRVETMLFANYVAILGSFSCGCLLAMDELIGALVVSRQLDALPSTQYAHPSQMLDTRYNTCKTPPIEDQIKHVGFCNDKRYQIG